MSNNNNKKRYFIVFYVGTIVDTDTKEAQMYPGRFSRSCTGYMDFTVNNGCYLNKKETSKQIVEKYNNETLGQKMNNLVFTNIIELSALDYETWIDIEEETEEN